MTRLDGFLLDFDGTLVNSVPVLYQVYREFLRKFGIQGTEQEFKSISGPSIPEFVKILMERYSLEGPISDLTAEYQARVSVVYGSALRPMTGAIMFLDIARARGLRLSIVTSAPHAMVSQWLHVQNLADRFELVVTSEGLLQSKPSPAIYLKALHLLELPADRVVAIEDSAHGVTAAIQAGIPTWQLALEPSQNDTPLYKGNASDWSELTSRCWN